MLWLALLGTAEAGPTCATEAGRFHHAAGVHALGVRDAEDGIAALSRCVIAEAGCAPCHLGLAATYATREEWALAIRHYEAALAVTPDDAAASAGLTAARTGLVALPHPAVRGGRRVPLGTAGGVLELTGRFQAYDPAPAAAADQFDVAVASPKSVAFSPDGSAVYVNALEAFKTLVYDTATLERRAVVTHTFDAGDAELFGGLQTVFGYPYLEQSPSGDPNQFSGKPVEMALSHGGRWLWVPYYRRDFDIGAGSPSAVAVVDTRDHTVARVLPTGPIPKYVAISPDDRWASVTHWGDNTVGLIDISSGDPARFAYRPERLVVEYVLGQEGLTGKNRDSACGFCLRGTLFTPDGETLLVARMGGAGGVAGLDVASGAYLGTVDGFEPNPRHLALSDDGAWLYVTSSRAGVVSKVALEVVEAALRNEGVGRVPVAMAATREVGGGVRTLDIAPDGSRLFVAVNRRAEVAVLDAETLQIVDRVRVDSYPVGLAVAPDGGSVWVTSQANRGIGGNAVGVLTVK